MKTYPLTSRQKDWDNASKEVYNIFFEKES